MKKIKRFNTQFEMKKTFILRDFLALERTTLANERTLFSYIRSGLYLSLAGIAILELKDFESIKALAYVLFFISLCLFVFGIFRYQILQNKLNTFYAEIKEEQEKED